MSGLTTQQELEAALPPPDDAPPEPIEIDLDSGEATEPPAAPVAPAAAAPKPRNKSSERIQTLARERDAERSMREQLSQELEQARRDAAQARSDAATAMQSGMENYAQRVTSEAVSAKEAYKAALSTGDADAIADAAAKLGKVSAAEADVDAWRAQQPTGQQKPAPQAPAPQAPQQPQQQQAPPPPVEVLDFLAENRWFDVYERNEDGTFVTDRAGRPIANPEFDEDMHDAAMILNKKIERQIRQGVLPREYQSTPEYFQQIRTEMQAQFPDAFEGDAEPAPQPQRRTPPMAPSRQPVAPATRSSLPSAPRPGGNKVTLSGEERQFVDSMIQNGAFRYPRGHQQAGKPMQPKDAYLEYAKQAQIQRANGPQQQ